jgi:predicted RNA-binding Zn-ribbon protein involved in translation (DUF1610 family)
MTGRKRWYSLQRKIEKISWTNSYKSMKLYNNYRFMQYHRPQCNNLKIQREPLCRKKEKRYFS